MVGAISTANGCARRLILAYLYLCIIPLANTLSVCSCIGQDHVAHLRSKVAIDGGVAIGAVTFHARRVSRASGMYAEH